MDHALYGTWEERGIHVLLFDAYGGRVMRYFQMAVIFSVAGNGCLTKSKEENKIERYETIILKN